jgi:hypothetical protein
MIDLFDAFHKLVIALELQAVDYALCEGLAMAVHGFPRATVDIDLLILSKSLDQAMTIARDLGYTIRGKDLSFARGAFEIRRVSKIDSASGDRLSLDFLLVTSETLPAWESRMEADWEGGKLSVVSREGLIKMKHLRGSGQDLDDIEKLRS